MYVILYILIYIVYIYTYIHIPTDNKDNLKDIIERSKSYNENLHTVGQQIWDEVDISGNL